MPHTILFSDVFKKPNFNQVAIALLNRHALTSVRNGASVTGKAIHNVPQDLTWPCSA
jgi:hypothetical protein